MRHNNQPPMLADAMAPSQTRHFGSLYSGQAIQAIRPGWVASERQASPDEATCHGWSCYNSAQQAGIVFIAILIPVLVAVLYWFIIVKPKFEESAIAAAEAQVLQQYRQQPPQPPQPPPQQAPPQAPPQTVEPPPEQPVQDQPQPAQAPPENLAPPEKANEAPSPLQASQKTPVDSLKKLPPAVLVGSVSPTATRASPAAGSTINSPQKSGTFQYPSVAPSSSPPKSEPAEQAQQQQPQLQQPQFQQPVPQARNLAFPFPLGQTHPPVVPGQPLGSSIFALPPFISAIPPPPPPLATTGQPMATGPQG